MYSDFCIRFHYHDIIGWRPCSCSLSVYWNFKARNQQLICNHKSVMEVIRVYQLIRIRWGAWRFVYINKSQGDVLYVSPCNACTAWRDNWILLNVNRLFWIGWPPLLFSETHIVLDYLRFRSSMNVCLMPVSNVILKYNQTLYQNAPPTVNILSTQAKNDRSKYIVKLNTNDWVRKKAKYTYEEWSYAINAQHVSQNDTCVGKDALVCEKQGRSQQAAFRNAGGGVSGWGLITSGS